jgi:hypothetical protein
MAGGPLKTVLFVGVLTYAAFGSAPARGEVDKAVCLDAVSKGQRLRDAHRLVEAGKHFRVCARVECPAVIQSDCANWLADLERTVPTVVLSAKDDSGRDLVDVTVSVDGQPLVGALDGQAVAVNPGLRTFRFEGPDGAVATQQRLVKEGEKAQSVLAVFSRSDVSPDPSPAAPDSARSSAAAPPGTALRVLGLSLGGTGVVGMAVGVAVALDAKSKDNRAAGEAGTARRADSASAVGEGNVATVVVGIGMAMAVAGVVLWLTAPRAKAAGRTSSHEVRSLSVGTNGILQGTF